MLKSICILIDKGVQILDEQSCARASHNPGAAHSFVEWDLMTAFTGMVAAAVLTSASSLFLFMFTSSLGEIYHGALWKRVETEAERGFAVETGGGGPHPQADDTADCA